MNNEGERKKLPKHMRPKRCLHNAKMRVIPPEANQVNDGAASARIIQAVFNGLSEFKLRSIGTEATTGYVEGLIPTSPDLDFEVLLNGVRIAQLDATGSNYTYRESRIMPVRGYKGFKVKAIGIPTFFVYWMKKESGLLKDCCYWIKGEDVIKAPMQTRKLGYKDQDNYMTNKADWHKGLESLIEELRRII